MGQILPFRPCSAAVDEAWQRYSELAQRVVDEPRLIADRRYMEAMTRAQRQWIAAFNALEEGR